MFELENTQKPFDDVRKIKMNILEEKFWIFFMLNHTKFSIFSSGEFHSSRQLAICYWADQFGELASAINLAQRQAKISS